MIGEAGFAEIFASPTLTALLRVFLLRADASVYQRELVDAAGARLYTVQRELARMERAGLILRAPRGNRVYYRANRAHPAFEDLKQVFLKTVALGDGLRIGAAKLAGRVRVAFVYGSYAAGQETPASDLDLFLIGDASSREVASVLGPLGRQLGRELNAVVYSPADFRAKAHAKHRFVAEVLAGPKTFIIGDEHELDELVGRGEATSASDHAPGNR